MRCWSGNWSRTGSYSSAHVLIALPVDESQLTKFVIEALIVIVESRLPGPGLVRSQ